MRRSRWARTGSCSSSGSRDRRAPVRWLLGHRCGGVALVERTSSWWHRRSGPSSPPSWSGTLVPSARATPTRCLRVPGVAAPDGQVTLPAATHDPFFRPWLTGSLDGRIFFQYEPGCRRRSPLRMCSDRCGWPRRCPPGPWCSPCTPSRSSSWAIAGSLWSPPGWSRRARSCSSTRPHARLFTTLLAVLVLLTDSEAHPLGAALGGVRSPPGSDAVDAPVGRCHRRVGAGGGGALLRRPVRTSDAVRGVAWVTLGFIPWLVLALLFNLRTTGS